MGLDGGSSRCGPCEFRIVLTPSKPLTMAGAPLYRILRLCRYEDDRWMDTIQLVLFFDQKDTQVNIYVYIVRAYTYADGDVCVRVIRENFELLMVTLCPPSDGWVSSIISM